ncbi:MAG: DUF1573 domain-containing protein [Chthoniobacterales bacterium]|nr:DUF1573 domain-containing protein [Chthoniobacterales bacterium]
MFSKRSVLQISIAAIFFTLSVAYANEVFLKSNSLVLDELAKGDEVARSLTVVNSGKTPVFIRKVIASCGCTAVLDGDREVPAHSELVVSLLTKGPKQAGSTIHVFVIFDQPDELKLHAKLEFISKEAEELREIVVNSDDILPTSVLQWSRPFDDGWKVVKVKSSLLKNGNDHSFILGDFSFTVIDVSSLYSTLIVKPDRVLDDQSVTLTTAEIRKLLDRFPK